MSKRCSFIYLKFQCGKLKVSPQPIAMGRENYALLKYLNSHTYAMGRQRYIFSDLIKMMKRVIVLIYWEVHWNEALKIIQPQRKSYTIDCNKIIL